MNRDIVERLRCFGYGTTNPEVCKEAADTIESLRARVAELEAEETHLDGCVANWKATAHKQAEQLAAQALTIKTMREALEKFIDSHEECTDFDGFTAQIVSMDDYHEAQEALAIPGNSTEVLQEWLDKQLGEPVVWKDKEARNRVIFPPMKPEEGDDGWDALFRKPEIK